MRACRRAAPSWGRPIAKTYQVDPLVWMATSALPAPVGAVLASGGEAAGHVVPAR